VQVVVAVKQRHPGADFHGQKERAWTVGGGETRGRDIDVFY
jgi:hypothetical protein